MKTIPEQLVRNNVHGLTKREHMAIEFTKAIIGNPTTKDVVKICADALMVADELIKQLNQPNQPT